MRYMLMSNVDHAAMAALPPEGFADLMKRYVDFTTALAQSGVMRGAEHLQGPDTATTMRIREGQTVLTDGPFADVTEVFGGFWIVEAPDLDTALEYASECPAVEVGSVEIRPLNERG